MAGKRFVVVGNGVAGTTAAETLRKLDPACQVTLLGDEPYPLYNRVALPRVLQGRMPPERTIMRSEAHHADWGIDLRLGTAATSVDWDRRRVRVAAGEELEWDGLLLATGGRPRRLAAAGGASARVLPFQTLDDTRSLVAAARLARETHGDAASAVAIGGSFISYELSEGFHRQGLSTRWLMRGPRFLRRILDDEAGALVRDIAEEHQVEVVPDVEVTAVRDGAALEVATTDGRSFAAHVAGAGVGLALNTEWLAGSPLRLDPGDGAIVVDDRLFTGIPGVYAAGDAASFFDPFLGRHHRMGTWDNALMHGRVAAENLLGSDRPYREVPTYSSPLFHSNIAVLGLTPEDEPNVTRESRTDRAAKSSRTLFLLDGRLVGALLVGNIRGRKRLLDLIAARERVDPDVRRQLLAGEV